MPYAILRFQKRKAGSVAACERHNERKKEAYKSNPDIDIQRSKDNYHLVAPPKYTYKKEINRMVREVGCKVRRDSVMMVETLITASPEFMNSLPPAEQKAYFKMALDFIAERAFAYKMKLEAMKRQGFRTDLTSAQLGEKLTSVELLARQSNNSRTQIQRFIRLTELIPPILQMVDEDKIALTPAVELSFLKKDEQNDLLVTMESEDATPSLSQAQRMKRLSQQGRLDMDTIFEIMTEEKANQKETIKFSADRIKKYFPKNTTPKQMEDYIIRLLERELQRKRNRDSR